MSICRQKSSGGRNDAENERTETTSNITCGDSTNRSQHLGKGVPLVDMPNNTVNMDSGSEHPTPPAPPIYAEILKDPSANAAIQSEAIAPAGDIADGDDCTNPPIIYQELTLVDK